MNPAMPSIRWGPRGGRRVAAAALAAALLLAPAGARAERSLQEEILRSKYRWGDYAIYVGWYDPGDAAFDRYDHKYALPIGGKIRLRLRGPIRLETDFSYYRRGDDPQPGISAVGVPEFDGLVVSVAVQAMLPDAGRFRPYAGAGPVFVSLASDFYAQLVDVPEGLVDRFVLAAWSELDFGAQALVGVDLFVGRRVFPFVEYRHLFGEFGIDEIRVGPFAFEAEDLAYYDDGLPVGDRCDWSGPNFMAGLKIRF